MLGGMRCPRSYRIALLLVTLGSAACRARSSAPAKPQPSSSAAIASPPAASVGPDKANRPPRNPAELVFPGAEPPGDATTLAYGVRQRVLKPGTAAPSLPGFSADVSVWSRDGRLVFTTYARQPMPIPLEGLPEAFRGAVSDVGLGGDAIFWVPRDAIPPDRRPPSIPAQDLVVRLEPLGPYVPPSVASSARHASLPPLPPPLPPPDAAKPHPEATRLDDGLSFVVAAPGEGAPIGRDTEVTLFVTAWVATASKPRRVLDNYKLTTAPAKAPAGLGEVITRLSPGGRARVWVPNTLSERILPQHRNQSLVVDLWLPPR